MREQIIEALRKLDPANDDHWTGQGLARVDVVAKFSGIPTLTRKDMADVMPLLVRSDAAKLLSQLGIEPGEDQPCFDEGEPEQGDIATISPDVASLEYARTQLVSELEQVRQQRSELLATEVDLSARVDKLTTEIEVRKPSQTTTDAILTYQKRQNELRAARVNQIKTLIDEGIVDRTATAAPIDAAMKMHRGYGIQRPQFPKPQ